MQTDLKFEESEEAIDFGKEFIESLSKILFEKK